jgi:hypothetical protein
MRLLDSKIPGRVGDALTKERLAVCYESKHGVGSAAWGSRKRKSAIWSVMSAETWLAQAKYVQAQRCLNEARKLYDALPHGNGISKFVVASDALLGLQRHLSEKLEMDYAGDDDDDDEGERGRKEEKSDGGLGGGLVVDEESEALDTRPRRASMLSRSGAPGVSLESAPLRDDLLAGEGVGDNSTAQNDFG